MVGLKSPTQPDVPPIPEKPIRSRKEIEAFRNGIEISIQGSGNCDEGIIAAQMKIIKWVLKEEE